LVSTSATFKTKKAGQKAANPACRLHQQQFTQR